MEITFLHHSAFLVRLPEATLLFDWTGEPLPDLDRSKPLYVFASHHHADHYTPEIFRLGMENVTYVLATCIRLSAKRKAQYAIDESRVVRLSAGKTARVGQLTVTTYRSTDAGVAFLVKAGEKTLFHAGDLNWWHWEGEDPAWNAAMARDFSAACDRLRGVAVDAAFLPLDPRLGDAFWWGFHRFMTTLDAAAAFPMHCWGDFSVIPRLKSLPESAPYRARVADITGDGLVFSL